jgi:predicted kinase
MTDCIEWDSTGSYGHELDMAVCRIPGCGWWAYAGQPPNDPAQAAQGLSEFQSWAAAHATVHEKPETSTASADDSALVSAAVPEARSPADFGIVFTGALNPTGYPGRVPTLVVARGLPACGKSTALAAWRAEDPDRRILLGRDARRDENGFLPVGTGAEEDAITVMMNAGTEALLRYGWDVGIDATHLQPGTLEVWSRIAERTGARFEILDLTFVSADTCVARDLARKHAGGRYVSESVIRGMDDLYLTGGEKS